MYRYKLPTYGSNNGSSVDPCSTKTPILENTSNLKPEPYVPKTERTVEQVHAPTLVTEYNFTVQTEVDPSNPAHAPTQFSLIQQKRICPLMLQPMGKLVLVPDKEDHPSSPFRDHKGNLATKFEKEKDYGVIKSTLDGYKIPFREHSHSYQEKVEPAKDYKVINYELDMPSTTVTDQKYRASIKVGPPTNYAAIKDKCDRPRSPIHDQAYGSPTKNSLVIDKKQDKHSTLVHDHGYKSPIVEWGEKKSYRPLDSKLEKTTNPIYESPEKVEKFVKNVQTEVSQPMTTSFLRGKNWHNIGGNNGYGEYNNYNKKDFDKPNIDNMRYQPYAEPYILSRNEWEGQTQKEWALPPTQETPIFVPINYNGKAVENLKEVVRSVPSPGYNINYPYSRIPLRDAHAETIDGREAERRYGNPNSSAMPSANYTKTISSTEAARKYGGSPVSR